MLHQVLLLLSSVSLALALGYGSGQYITQHKIEQQIGPYSIGVAGSGNEQPSPYSFSYASSLKEGSTSHRESGDGSGKVTGSYSLSQNDGRKRTVDYSADAGGFVASIQTNEFGTKSENPAHVTFLSSAQQGPVQTSHAAGTYGGQSAGQLYSSVGQQGLNQATQYAIGSAADGQPFPYSFNYNAQLEDGSSSRSESSDGSGTVSGSYSLSVKDGRHRNVQYSADASGFKASVDTNEFGTKSDSPADVKFLSSAPADASFSAPHGFSGQPGAAPSYAAVPQGSYQPAQYSSGSAPEGKPFPYSFSYSSQAEDGSSSHSESSDGSGKVSGSYSLSVNDGRRRNVQYSADASGFKASVDTNEFGTKSDSPADVKFYSSAPADASFSSPHGPGAPQPGAPASYASFTPGAPQPGAPTSYAPIGQTSYQPTQYSSGSAPEGKPFPYSFSYSSQAEDGSSSRSEASDGSGKVSGSYSLSVNDGRRRNVQYSADASGFKASVDTNEFGTKSDNPADVKFYSSAPADASFSSPLGPGAPQPGAPASYASFTPGAPQPGASPSYAPLGQASYQPTQYSAGAAPEGKPFPYSFSYDNKWQDGGSARKESSDGSGKVTGSYSLFNTDGRSRTVDYSADTGGFKASVQTNEFGTKSDSPADVQFYSSAPAAVAPGAQGPSVYSSVASGQAAHYGQITQIQQQHQPIQFSMGSAPEGQPSPYSFSYQSELGDGSSSHKESSDGAGKVTGSYSLTHKDGRRRFVGYVADLGGYRASVETNELGTKSDNPADVKFLSSAPSDFPAAGGATSGSTYQSSSSTAQLYGPSIGYQPQGPQSPSASGQPSPYQFDYQADAAGGASSRKEAADSSGKVTGAYSVTNKDGSGRLVEYVADKAGFRAKVKTNEPGTKSDNPADVTFDSSAPAPHPAAQAHSSVSIFPARTYTPKSSMIGQVSQAKLW